MTADAAPSSLLAQLLRLSTAENALPCAHAAYGLFEAEGYRWLCSPPGAVQTVMRIDSPEALLLANQRAMLLAALLPEKITRMLDLGCGGGGFVRFFAHHQPQVQITSVDKDAAMVQLARSHFGLPGGHGVHVTDGLQFLRDAPAPFDLIFVDMFQGREAPAALAQGDSFAAISQSLTPGGAVALNTLPATEDELRALLTAARAHFTGVGVLNFSEQGNVVLVLQKHHLPALEQWQEALGRWPDELERDLTGHLKRLVRV